MVKQKLKEVLLVVQFFVLFSKKEIKLNLQNGKREETTQIGRHLIVLCFVTSLQTSIT